MAPETLKYSPNPELEGYTPQNIFPIDQDIPFETIPYFLNELYANYPSTPDEEKSSFLKGMDLTSRRTAFTMSKFRGITTDDFCIPLYNLGSRFCYESIQQQLENKGYDSLVGSPSPLSQERFLRDFFPEINTTRPLGEDVITSLILREASGNHTKITYSNTQRATFDDNSLFHRINQVFNDKNLKREKYFVEKEPDVALASVQITARLNESLENSFRSGIIDLYYLYQAHFTLLDMKKLA